MPCRSAAIVVLGALLGWGVACSGDTREVNVADTTGSITPVTITYGADPSQFGQLWRAGVTSVAARPVVVLVHGGFWRSAYGLDLMDPMARDLLARGFAVWNIEYRRVGQAGGGHPGTFDDVAAAIDHLTNIGDSFDLDLGMVSVIGHSAGGHLALWSAGRAGALVVPRAAIGLGAVVDLELAATKHLGNDAVIEFLDGTPAEVPDRYVTATPRRSVDGVRMVSVRASGDDIVPAEFTVPREPHEYEVVDVLGDHFTLIDPAHDSWPEVVSRLAR
jgi:acetyl esterase/lipase